MQVQETTRRTAKQVKSLCPSYTWSIGDIRREVAVHAPWGYKLQPNDSFNPPTSKELKDVWMIGCSPDSCFSSDSQLESLVGGAIRTPDVFNGDIFCCSVCILPYSNVDISDVPAICSLGDRDDTRKRWGQLAVEDLLTRLNQ